MHVTEAAELESCIECGAEIWPERERSYLLSDDDVLCYACTRRRGGVYNELEDRWVTKPDLTGLKLSPP